MINNLLKKLVCIKTENILILLYIPYMIINTARARQDLFIVAIVMHLLLSVAIYYSIKETRQDLKQYVYQLKPIKIIDLQAIKKRYLQKHLIINQPQPLLNNSTFKITL